MEILQIISNLCKLKTGIFETFSDVFKKSRPAAGPLGAIGRWMQGAQFSFISLRRAMLIVPSCMPVIQARARPVPLATQESVSSAMEQGSSVRSVKS